MIDREHFMRAICAAPHDDLPRLVFADALDEHGDGQGDVAFAEFIRVQCDMAATKCEHPAAQWCDCAQCRRARRCVELFDQWMASFLQIVGVGNPDVFDYQFLKNTELSAIPNWRRGFPYRMSFLIPDAVLKEVPRKISKLFESLPFELIDIRINPIRQSQSHARESYWIRVWVSDYDAKLKAFPVHAGLSIQRLSRSENYTYYRVKELRFATRGYSTVPKWIRGCVRSLLKRRQELNEVEPETQPQSSSPPVPFDPRVPLDPRRYITGRNIL